MNSTASYEQNLTSAAQKTLVASRKSATSGLQNESEADTTNRLLEIENRQSRWNIHLGSDGLSLDNKLYLEKSVLAGLGINFPKEAFAINFRRTKTNTQHTPARGPASLSNSPGAYGLKQKRKRIPGVKRIIVVASGKGGVGKSTVSTNLALAYARSGLKVGLLDADVYGPSSPTMLGLKGPLPVDELGQLTPLESHHVKTVSFGFLSDSYHPVIWRGPLVSKAIEQFCFDVTWGNLDLLVVDLPPGTGDVQLSLIETLSIQGALIITTPQDVALIDAHKALSMFRNLSVPVLGMVENMREFICPNCGHAEPIFGANGPALFSSERRIPILGSLAIDPTLRLACDTGNLNALEHGGAHLKPFDELAQAVLARLDTKPEDL